MALHAMISSIRLQCFLLNLWWNNGQLDILKTFVFVSHTEDWYYWYIFNPQRQKSEIILQFPHVLRSRFLPGNGVTRIALNSMWHMRDRVRTVSVVTSCSPVSVCVQSGMQILISVLNWHGSWRVKGQVFRSVKQFCFVSLLFLSCITDL